MRKTILISLTTVVLFGCKSEKDMLQDLNFVEAENAATRMAAVADPCTCLSASQVAPCNDGSTDAIVINQFLGGNTTVTKTIHWGKLHKCGR